MARKSSKGTLTTTSYAILGLLSLRSWSTYELAQQMARSLHNFWPRAESKVYLEPKKLVAHGLAEVRIERTGKRRARIYSITPAGRAALAAWLEEPGAGPTLEFEGILKVFFADQGSQEGLLRAIRAIRADSDEALRKAGDYAREYLQTGGPFPERLHIIRLMVAFLDAIDETVARWAAWAEDEVVTWDAVSGDRRPQTPDDVFRRILERGRSHVAGE